MRPYKTTRLPAARAGGPVTKLLLSLTVLLGTECASAQPSTQTRSTWQPLCTGDSGRCAAGVGDDPGHLKSSMGWSITSLVRLRLLLGLKPCIASNEAYRKAGLPVPYPEFE